MATTPGPVYRVLRVTQHTVPSLSRPGLEHVVTVQDGRAACDCEGFTHHRKCWHVSATLAGLAGPGTVRTLLAATLPELAPAPSCNPASLLWEEA